MLALDGAQTFPAAPELLFRMIERRRVPLHPDLDIRINVSRDRPEPAQFPGCLSILAHAPDLTAILRHDIIKAVSVDRGDAGLTEDEGHARIVPGSTPRWLHQSLNSCALGVSVLSCRWTSSRRSTLSLYSLYYNGTRTHLGLGKDARLRRSVQRSGPVVTTRILSGLHHRYVLI